MTERDRSAFEDILFFLSRHPDLEKWELRDDPILSLPGLEINLARRKITSDGREISLTAKEYDILCLLAANKNRVLTYDQIYEKVWGDVYAKRKYRRLHSMLLVLSASERMNKQSRL